MNNDEVLKTRKDTVIYQAYFDIKEDSIYMKTGESIWRIRLLHRSSNHHVLQFFNGERLVGSLKIKLNKRYIRVNKDVYVLDTDVKNHHRFDIMTAINLLKDNLGDYPRDEFEILRLNWGVPYHSYKIKSAISYVKDPYGNNTFTFDTRFLYDKRGNLVKIEQADRLNQYVRYELSDLIYKAGVLQSYHVYYDQDGSMSDDYIYERVSDTKEVRKGTWIHAASGKEYHYTQTYIRIE